MRPSPILVATPANIGRWIDTAKQMPVTDEEKALIDTGSPDGRRLFFVILFARSFLKLDASFHATLHDYCSRIIDKNLAFHEAASVALFLDYVMIHVAEMTAVEFINPELAELAIHPSVTTFIQRFPPRSS